MEKTNPKPRNPVVKLRLLPLYWKIVITILAIIGGWTAATSLFFSGSDIALVSGVLLGSILVWLLLNTLVIPDGKSGMIIDLGKK